MARKEVLIGLLFLGIVQLSASSTWKPANTDTLKLVQVIFRHGDRAPTKFYPNDPHYDDFDKLWPEGFAQLTNRGKMQQYELGQFLRQRYDGFLAKKYSPKELYVTSSDMDRTIMSLESNLAGLFPPVVDPWNPQIEWQPIPLRTIPRKEDKYLHNYVKCPRYSELRSDFYSSSQVVKKMNDEHQDFIHYCAQNSGLDISTVKGLYPLLDILYAQASHNYTLPKWAQGDTLQKLLEINGIVNTWPTYTDEMKRLWGGPFLHLLLKNMQAIAGHLGAGSAPGEDELIHSIHHGVNRKMLMYSAHDSTLERIMNTMGVFEPHCPPYASALMIELHRDADTLDYFIQIHYRNDTTREPYMLTHPKCDHPCTLDTYLELVQHLIPVDWKKECRLNLGADHIDSGFFTSKDNQLEEDDDNDDQNGQSGKRKGVKAVLRLESSDNHWTSNESSCYPTASQWLLLGLGLIVSSTLSAFVIVKVLQYRSGSGALEGDYVRSSGRPFFVEVLSTTNKPPCYRSTYEQLY